MKEFPRNVTAMLFCIALAACATDGAPRLQQMTAPVVPEVGQGESRFGALPPRKLAAGECGMFLWLRNAERKLVFFGAGAGTAKAMIDGREVEMTRIAIGGREAFGQYEDQTYTYPGHRLQLHIGFEQRAGLDRGVVVPQGTLRLQQDDGWEYILPVGGLVACEG